MSHDPQVSIVRKGANVDLNLETGLLEIISINGEAVPPDERGGIAKKLLASSALYCYCAALDKALDARNAKYDRIEGRATVQTGVDDKGRGRVTGIVLDVTVFMSEEYEFIFERVEKIMRNGCLVTGSLEAAFPVRYNLQLNCDEDN